MHAMREGFVYLKIKGGKALHNPFLNEGRGTFPCLTEGISPKTMGG